MYKILSWFRSSGSVNPLPKREVFTPNDTLNNIESLLEHSEPNDLIEQALSYLIYLLTKQNSTDLHRVTVALYRLIEANHNSSKLGTTIQTSALLTNVAALLDHKDEQIRYQVTKILASIAHRLSKQDGILQRVRSLDLVNKILSLLEEANMEIRIEVTKAITGLASNSSDLRQAIIQQENILSSLASLLLSPEFALCHNAVQAFYQLTKGPNSVCLAIANHPQVLQSFVALLIHEKATIRRYAVRALYHLSSESEAICTQISKQENIQQHLEALQKLPDHLEFWEYKPGLKTTEYATHILDRLYFFKQPDFTTLRA